MDAYDRCLAYYKLITAWGEPPRGAGGAKFWLSHSKLLISAPFLSFFFGAVGGRGEAIPLYGSREEKLDESICKMKKAKT